MFRHYRIAAMTIVLLLGGNASAQELWVSKDGSIRNADARAMALGQGQIFLATRSEVYRSSGPQGRWESVFALPSGDNEIASIASGHGGIYVGTRRGLYRSLDGGRTWGNVFKTVIPEKSSILSISLPAPGAVIVGTERGLFMSADRGAGWKDISGTLKNKRIACVVSAQGAVYASSDEGVFARRSGSDGWERVYIKTGSGDEPLPDEAAGAYEIEEVEQGLSAPLAVCGARLYAATGKKILFSVDGGRSWTDIPTAGLSGPVNCLLPSGDGAKLYAASTKGVFEYSPEKTCWAELYRGMGSAAAVRSIIFDAESDGLLWAITDRGICRYEAGRFIEDSSIDIERGMEGMRIIYDGEPAFRDLQKAAMNVAEVEPEKVKAWRTEARLRALIPTVSLGIDNSTSNTYEIYTSATKDYVVNGPDDISKGFDVSVSWDLGDILFSGDQTNIDVRSRLTTQLRNDILDDLRRVYYERKRLQFEILTSPPRDMKMRFEKELRIRELTQAIDDLTGNYLTDHMRSPDENGLQK